MFFFNKIKTKPLEEVRLKKNIKTLAVNFYFILILTSTPLLYSQVALEADGSGNTYELITSVLAPGNNAVDDPDCSHPEFGRHITEAWDVDLNQNVFEFYSHATPDNDRCINTDRQRIEIKTNVSSPDNLKAVAGEIIIYK